MFLSGGVVRIREQSWLCVTILHIAGCLASLANYYLSVVTHSPPDPQGRVTAQNTLLHFPTVATGHSPTLP